MAEAQRRNGVLQDEYGPVLDKQARSFRQLLSFEPPKHSPTVRRLAYAANRVYLRFGFGHGRVTVEIPERDLARLKALPAGCGNILIGPHPAPLDANLMFHLVARAHEGPAVFLMAAEAFFRGPRLGQAVLSRLGVIPVARGRKNPAATDAMVRLIASGWWGGIFPEGEVYFSREVMPMEYGALRIAVEAGLDRENASASGAGGGVFLTPFSHVYFFDDHAETERRASAALQELEANPNLSLEASSGDLPGRVHGVADKVLATKAAQYGIPKDEWEHEDRFERNRRLQDAVLKRLEIEYLGKSQTAHERRRAVNVRMACYELLAKEEVSPSVRQQIKQDVQKTHELILMTPFSRAYHDKYDDLEMWVEVISRFRAALGMRRFNFGPQTVVLKVHDPIQVHPQHTQRYAALQTEALRRQYLSTETEVLRATIQAGIDEICRARRSATGDTHRAGALARNEVDSDPGRSRAG